MGAYACFRELFGSPDLSDCRHHALPWPASLLWPVVFLAALMADPCESAPIVQHLGICELDGEQPTTEYALEFALGCEEQGCTDASPLEFDIFWERGPLHGSRAEGHLRFEDLADAVAQGMAVDPRIGSGRWRGSTLTLGTGERATIKLPSDPVRAIRVKLSVSLSRKAVRRLRNQPGDSVEPIGHLAVKQHKGPNRSARNIADLLWHYGYCPPARQRKDRVTLSGSASPRRAVALVSAGGKDACVTDRISVSRGRNEDIGLGALASEPACHSRLTIMPAGGRMEMMERFSPWQNNRNDVVHLHTRPPIDLRLEFWIVSGDAAVQRNRIAEHLDIARAVFDLHQLGATFLVDSPRDMTSHPKAHEYREVSGATKPDIDAVIGASGRAINVYYLEHIHKAPGIVFEGPVILIGDNAAPTTLAHEIGHALGLSHSDGVKGMSTYNLMSDFGSRSFLSVGQIQRANISEFSALNLLQLRPGEPVGTCDHTSRMNEGEADEGPWPNSFRCAHVSADWRVGGALADDLPAPPVPSPLDLWMACSECTVEHFKNAVEDFGFNPERNLAAVVDALMSAQTPAARAKTEIELRETYALRLGMGRSSLPDSPQLAEFVDRYSKIRDAMVRDRAAVILLAIPECSGQFAKARAALDAATKRGDLVRQALARARKHPFLSTPPGH